MLYFKCIANIIYFYNRYSCHNVKIEYKIGKDIITNLDIIDEKNLIFLRPSLKNLRKTK